MNTKLGISSLRYAALAALALLLFFALPLASCSRSDSSPQTPPSQAKEQTLAPTGGKVTFLELGGVGCKACEAMVPVLDEIRRRYAGRVNVEFHDVRKDHDTAQRWRVVLIPTQVFLDASGSEYFRHEGFFSVEEVEEVLARGGVK